MCFYRNQLYNTQTRFNDVTSNVFKFIGNGQILAPKIRVMVARVKTDKNGRQKASGGCFLTFFWNKAVPKIVLYFFLKTIFYTVNSTSIIVEGKIMKIAMLIIVSLFILHGCTFLRYIDRSPAFVTF